MDITYRKAVADDAEAISKLIIESQREFCFHEYTGEGRKLMQELCSVPAISGYINRGDVYFVAEGEGEVVGVAGVRDSEHLSHNFVASAWHRRGISNRLWQLTREACLARGNPGRFSLNASTFAIPVYERWGFTVTGPKSFEHGLAFTPMEMSKSLLETD